MIFNSHLQEKKAQGMCLWFRMALDQARSRDMFCYLRSLSQLYRFSQLKIKYIASESRKQTLCTTLGNGYLPEKLEGLAYIWVWRLTTLHSSTPLLRILRVCRLPRAGIGYYIECLPVYEIRCVTCHTMTRPTCGRVYPSSYASSQGRRRKPPPNCSRMRQLQKT
jgi:hypothetical protein